MNLWWQYDERFMKRLRKLCGPITSVSDESICGTDYDDILCLAEAYWCWKVWKVR